MNPFVKDYSIFNNKKIKKSSIFDTRQDHHHGGELGI